MGFFDTIKNIFVPSVATAKASKGTIRNSWFSSTFSDSGESSPVALNEILELFRGDPVVQAAITTRVDSIMRTGWTLNNIGAKDKNKLKRLGFNYRLLDQAIRNLLLYEHVFLEVERKNNGEPVRFHVLETPYMTISHDDHGDISGFVEVGENGKPVAFSTDEVTYLRLNPVTTGVWGEVTLKSLYSTIDSKNRIEKFINQLARSNAWMHLLKTNMKEDDIKAFYAILNKHMQLGAGIPMAANISKDGNVSDMLQFELMRDPSDLKEFLGTLDYLRTQILMALKVPPIMIGLPDSSNRSNSDSQIKSYNSANDALRAKFQEFINQELLPLVGIDKEPFSWNPIDERSEKEDVEMAERLRNMGVKEKVITDFLRKSGLDIGDDDNIFKEGVEPKKSMDMFESRRGKSEGEANKKIGSGLDSTTREDQLL